MIYQDRFSVAPMLDWTTRHCRVFHRTMSKQALLYTEMVNIGAVVNAPYDVLGFNLEENPLVLQLGGSDLDLLKQAAAKAKQRGFFGLNLNVGCPSDRVQRGAFGACLMKNPKLVADLFKAAQDNFGENVSIKCRLGVDDLDSYEFLCGFIEQNINAGCKNFIVHARKAWLKGLSPKENREIPELNYQRVYQLKQQFPQIRFSLNGGVKSIGECVEHLNCVDGVMVGREAFHNPFKILAKVDEKLFNLPANNLTRLDVLDNMIVYVEQQLKLGVSLHHITNPMLGLFHGERGASVWKRFLSNNAYQKNSGLEVYLQALDLINNITNKNN